MPDLCGSKKNKNKDGTPQYREGWALYISQIVKGFGLGVVLYLILLGIEIWF